MNCFKTLVQQRTVAARIYSGKKNRLLYNQSKGMSHDQKLQKDKEAFYNILPEVIDSIAAHPAIVDVPDLEGCIKKLFQYNLLGGKAARGQTVVMAYETLEKPGNKTEETMRLARILGWCVEMFQTYLVILDDLMDQSKTRRGQPCWYLVPEVGISCAVNDSVLVYNVMFYLMRKNFGNRANYREMLDVINETLLLTAFGQFLDVKTSEMTNKDYKRKFSPERHHVLLKYKTAYYTYDLPIYLGQLLTGNKLDNETRKQIQDISIDLGTLFQIQDDYIDCYSDESLSGKVGTDIQNGKCSWLAVTALQRCNDAQRIVFNVCYGSKDPAHIERIKVLYDQLQLPQLYKEVEGRYYDNILDKIKDLPTEEWKMLFHRLLGITYQRKK